ncbi:MAG: glycoside hydrolase family 3 N-terminal domain-containing protein [Xenococcaceae cyanobacterium]
MAELLPDWTHLSLKEQIGQMVVVRASGYLFDHQILYPAWEPPAAKLRHWLQNLNLGGVILLGGSAGELALRSQQLQNWAKTPLLIAADIEEGVGQRFAGATWFPPPMALGGIARGNPGQAQHYALQMGAITASEALAIGINWILAPVVDVNNNPDNPVINVRAFADTPEAVSYLATAFIQGAKQYPILTTAKHFPGHGDTATDSHLDLPILPQKASRLAEVELPPFQRAIAAGVDSVMSAHLLIPEWDSEHPATLSEPILTGQLRQRLGFEGLIVTDALIMGGVANYAAPEEVAVMATEAGADILLMPSDPGAAIEAVYEAVRSGRLGAERISASVERIWKAKQKVNLKSPIQSPNSNDFLSQLAQPAAMKTADSMLREAMEMGGSLPLEPPRSGNLRNLIVVDDVLNCDFLDRNAPAVAVPKQLDWEVQLVDQNTLVFEQDDSSPTLLQVFIRGNPFRGSAGLTPMARDFYQKLLQTGSLQGLMIYGSPYVLDWFRGQIHPNLPWVFSYGQMPMAQAIACEVLLGLSRFADSEPEPFL